MSRALDIILRLRRLISLVIHAVLIVVANLAAFWLRFDSDIPDGYWVVAVSVLPSVLAIRLAVFVPFRLFEGLWKYASLWDLRNIILGVGVSSAVIYVVVNEIAPAPGYPRSIYFIDSLLLVCLLGGIRMSRRIYRELGRPAKGRRVLVYGAGDAGELIVRDMRQNAAYDAQPIGFVDDDPRKVGERIHGVKVLGTRDQLPRIIERTAPDEVLIAIPSASPGTLRAIVRELETYKVRISTLPQLADLVGEHIGVRQIRELKVEDLLARDRVHLDYGPVRAVLAGRRVLVTGAGGSIGSELCRQIAEAGPELLLLLDRYENSLFQVQNELREKYPRIETKAVVADITDARRLDQVLDPYRPHVIFHAAAHKHVPLMEDNPCEAIKNNVRGTRLLAEAALRWGVDRFVMISTDKAVNPVSVMGAAKRVAELLVKSLDAAKTTHFVVVRFGNVLGSNGSVVPRFLSQIARGGPVTVTDPEMRRYFMLIPEAVELVLQASAIEGRGSIYVLDMGEQIRVADMARDLIRLSGYIPEKEIALEYTGIRPGEKLYEELVGEDEVAESSPVPKIMRVHANHSSAASIDAAIVALENAAIDGNTDMVFAQLCQIVPGFKPMSRPVIVQQA